MLRVEDMTCCSQVVSVEENMGQYPNRQEEAGNNKHFIAIWVYKDQHLGGQDEGAADGG